MCKHKYEYEENDDGLVVTCACGFRHEISYNNQPDKKEGRHAEDHR